MKLNVTKAKLLHRAMCAEHGATSREARQAAKAVRAARKARREKD